MDCVIHIGTEKTGTTSIQKTLDGNVDLLEQGGVLWPSVLRSGQDTRIACYAMDDDTVDLRKKRRKLLTPEAIATFRSAFEERLAREIKAAPDARTMLIVNEHLSRMRNPSELIRLRKLLEGVVDRFRIVVYLRRQDRMMRSMYSQVIKIGGTRENVFPVYEAAKNNDFNTFNYRRIVDLWAGVFGADALDIRIFDRAHLVDGDVVADFFHAAGLERPEGLSPAKTNESLSREALLSLRELNRHLPREARGNITALSNQLFTGTGMPVARAEAAAFLGYFEQDNDDVARQYLDRDSLFDPIGDAEYPETLDPDALTVSVQTVAWHFAQLWEAKQKS